MTTACKPEVGFHLDAIGGPRLRVAVLLDSLTVPRWLHHLLQELEKSDFADLVVIATIQNNSAGNFRTSPWEPRLLRMWSAVDEKLFRTHSARPDAFDPVLFEPRRSHPEVTEVPRHAYASSTALSQRILEVVNQVKADVLLQLAPVPANNISSWAPHDVWLLSCSQSVTDLFWTLHDGIPVIANTLDVSGTGMRGRIACSYSVPDRISWFRARSNLCWKRSDSLLRCLSDLRRNGCLSVRNEVEPVFASRPAPTNFDALRLVFRLFARAIEGEFTKRLLREQWFIAFRRVSTSIPNRNEVSAFTVIRPPRGRFYADPFLIERSGRTYIFFEDYSYAQGKAAISFLEIDDDGRCSQPQVALEEDYHLAYPFLFEWQGGIYLLPETKNHRTVQLYRATDFPRRWEVASVLLRDISAVDSTLVRQGGKFWLFTSGLGTTDPWFDGDSELSLFFSDSLDGPWTPHPKNPIVRDARRARGAGQFFCDNTRLIRPAQDGSVAYGHAVSFNRVDCLSETDYAETPIARLDPEWMEGNRGTHTYNRSNRYEVVDGRTPILRFSRGSTDPVIEIVTTTAPVIKGL